MFRTILRWTVRLGAVAGVIAVVTRLVGDRDATPEATALSRSDVWPPVPAAPGRRD